MKKAIFNYQLPYDEKELENAKSYIFNPFPQIWNPSSKISENVIREHCAKLEAQYIHLKNNHESIKNKFKQANLIGKIGSIITLCLFFFIGTWPSLVLLFFSWSYYLSLAGQYHSLALGLVKLQIAKIKQWVYDPEENIDMWDSLKQQQPELFLVGNKNQKIYDQFWGSTVFEGKTYWFYLANFFYREISESAKDRQEYPIYKNFITLYMPKEIKKRFMIFPQLKFSVLNNIDESKEIDLESNSFNKKYAFKYEGSKDEASIEILKTLSPAVQEKLVLLSETKNKPSVLFTPHSLTFMFDGVWNFNLKTNFKNSPEVIKEDINTVDKELEKVIDIANEVIKYLD